MVGGSVEKETLSDIIRHLKDIHRRDSMSQNVCRVGDQCMVRDSDYNDNTGAIPIGANGLYKTPCFVSTGFNLLKFDVSVRCLYCYSSLFYECVVHQRHRRQRTEGAE
jgi:hypothetical protein